MAKGAKIMNQEIEKRINELEKEVERLVNYLDSLGYEQFKTSKKLETLEDNLDSEVDSLQD